MYPLRRLLLSPWFAKRAGSIAPTDIAEKSFYCTPWDIDMFLEMNNGRVLTLYDLGRFDFAIRSGLSNVLKRQNWGLVVAGSTVRYRRRIRAFDRVIMRTQFAGAEGRWIYVQQSMWVKGEPCNSILLRTAITEKGRAIEASLAAEAMGLEDWEKPSQWVHAWIDADAERPWPPSI